MKIAVLKERQDGETRVAATPETVKKYAAAGASVAVETGAGTAASFTDDQYRAAGAEIAADAKSACLNADMVLKVQRPDANELACMANGAKLAAILAPHTDKASLEAYAKAGIDAFAMELMPRITRAQSMDVLSSQSNLAGYKAVIDAAAAFGKALPILRAGNYLSDSDLSGARSVLRAAAFTYVAAALASLLDLARWIRVLR